MATFQERLKMAMELKNISQVELCKRTGITKSAMSQYLSGSFKPKQKRTYLLAKALNVSEAWLIGMENADMERHDSMQMAQITNQDFHITDHEKRLVVAYRRQPEMQHAVDTLLGITDAEEQKEKRA